MSSKAGVKELALRRFRQGRGDVAVLETVDTAERDRRWPKAEKRRLARVQTEATAMTGGRRGPPDPPPRGGEVASAASPRKRPKKFEMVRRSLTQSEKQALEDEAIEIAQAAQAELDRRGGKTRGPGRPGLEGSVRLTITLSGAMHEALERRAEAAEVGVAEIIRSHLQFALDEKIPDVG